ncbi:MAG: 2,3-bisphosphoglycerate-independent phosphoglycerate mutase, partial [Rickettsiales bacterium]
WDALTTSFPLGKLSASAEAVGLPEGQMGNSEVGHMNIGSGRTVLQDLPRIDKTIADGKLAALPEFQSFVNALKNEGSGTCHLMGLLSPGGVHSHQAHLAALALELAKSGISVNVHAFLDGRDTPPKSALGYVRTFEKAIAPQQSMITLATVSGRYYAMDRDKRWDRTEKAYLALTSAQGEAAPTAIAAIEQAYAADASDEFVLPTIVNGYAGMQDGDGILMANFRADRARQILSALTLPGFDGFARRYQPRFSATLGMVEYSSELASTLSSLFPPENITETLGEVVSRAGMKQLRIAETEKYAHVTFFLNAGRETEYDGEERILIPSPKVATYDMQPEMSAYEVTQKLEAAIASETFDLIVVNYANADMVGHTGDMQAAIKAVEAVDSCIGRLKDAVFAKGGALLVTADHGNIEQMMDHSTHQSHTAHTLNLVPFIVAYAPWEGRAVSLPEGKLADVAPTVLELLQIPQPAAM